MRRYYYLLSLIMLMSIVFPFTSCRNADRSTINRYHGTISDENEKDDDGEESESKLQKNEKDGGIKKSDLIKLLRSQGRPDLEIRAFMQLEKENDYLDEPIGQIVWVPGHYMYEVNGRRYDGIQTINACAIWAVRRILRHMILSGKYPSIAQDAWYRDSDSAIRQRIGDWAAMYNPGEDERDARGTGQIVPSFTVLLQKYYGIPDEQNSVYYDGTKYPPNKRLYVPAGQNSHGFKYSSTHDLWGNNPYVKVNAHVVTLYIE
ncbi:MAG: hypothetical protein LBD17_03685 [Endomicrobium sp.]|jgi:hypothetical protein|nr:hypothetical protein [Endomicrobium sp.]